MKYLRRTFLKQVCGLGAASAGLGAASPALAGDHSAGPSDPMGVLVDLSQCVGCRLCEYACRDSNGIETGPLESYDDQSVFSQRRRPAPDAFTVVNAFDPVDVGPVYAKTNCMHCNHPACASACIVGALKKTDNGPVTYDAWKCIGCRYCMVACPFQIPTYEYDDVFTPEVRKCTFCHERTSEGRSPACVEACPREVMVCGKRNDLIALAHERIAENPDRYIDHVYGEHEVGGTSWMYLSPASFDEVGMLDLDDSAPPVVTEKIQHGVFKYGIPPLALYGVLGAAMFITKRRSDASAMLTGGGAGAISLDPANLPAEVAEPAAPVTQAKPKHEAHAHDDEHHHPPQPVAHPYFTPGVWLLLMLATAGMAAIVYRFLFGIGAATNLDQQHPWGLWIGIDVATGVALAAGGFTSGALAHVFHREHYHAIVRPALLTAMLGYTFVVLGLQADLGRYYNVWHPLFMWQGNSVLFEVGLCVTCYLNVLYLEFAPIVCERLEQMGKFPRAVKLARWARARLEKVMFLLIIAGCVLSCLHQSSLGNLMVIAPSKLHPLWWSPYSPLMFLLSAIAVGFPMIIFESLFAGWSLKLKPEMNVLTPLSRYVPVFLGVYLAVKFWDLMNRGAYAYLLEGSIQSYAWMAEVGLGVVLPLVMLINHKVRQSPRLLFIAATLIVLGVAFNRVNVFLIGYHPPYAERTYMPSLMEVAVTVGLISMLMLIYRFCVLYLPVISHPGKPKSEVA